MIVASSKDQNPDSMHAWTGGYLVVFCLHNSESQTVPLEAACLSTEILSLQSSNDRRRLESTGFKSIQIPKA